MSFRPSLRMPPAMPSGFRIADRIRPEAAEHERELGRHVERGLEEREDETTRDQETARNRAGDARDAAEIREREEEQRLPVVELVGGDVSGPVRDHRATDSGDERGDAEREQFRAAKR